MLTERKSLIHISLIVTNLMDKVVTMKKEWLDYLLGLTVDNQKGPYRLLIGLDCDN